MTRLEDLTRDATIRGVHPDGHVNVVDVRWFGSTAVELVFKDTSGKVDTRLLYRDDEATLEVVAAGRSWAFDGDGALGINLNNRRFGEVSVFGTAPPESPINTDQTFGAKWITDLDLSYQLRNGLTVAGGANNLFDVYPDPNFRRENNADNSNTGIFVYNGISPFGFNGAFYYVRLSYGM